MKHQLLHWLFASSLLSLISSFIPVYALNNLVNYNMEGLGYLNAIGFQSNISSVDAYTGYSYRSEEFCDNSQSLTLVLKTSLTNPTVKTPLVKQTNACKVGAAALTPDSSHVYYLRYTNANMLPFYTTAIWRVKKDGTTYEQVIAENANNFLLGATTIYWSTATQIRYRLKQGGIIHTLYTAPPNTTIKVRAMDGVNIFFDQESGDKRYNQQHQIRHAPLNGKPAQTLYTLDKGIYINDLTLDTDNVYWTEQIFGNELQGALNRVGKDGKNQRYILPFAKGHILTSLAVTANKVYWVEKFGLDTRDNSIIRSRTQPTKKDGLFKLEVDNRQGILSGLFIQKSFGLFGKISVFWYERGWNTPPQVVKAEEVATPPVVFQ